ncbi:MAG: ABC transporter ATP-binding protein/permease [Rhodobacteraceae bacterium]|nr:ABC transporter ATP-binding protein/permease [Paracoccaceae bacterium]
MQTRVILVIVSLIAAKGVSVVTPMLIANVVDSLAGERPDPPGMLAAGALGLTFAYVVFRLLNIGFQELRGVLFAPVSQQALRRLGLKTFQHIHRLSLRYHISRKTGGLSRVMERGVKGVAFLLRFFLVSIGPLILELVLIGGVLWAFFDVRYLLVLLGTVVTYVVFTTMVTEWRVKIRRRMNAQDTDANQKAVDSLLNFETVKYFGAERFEAQRYDTAMAGYEDAAIRTTYSLSALNLGQAAIVNCALFAVLCMALFEVRDGSMTVGDFVLVNSYMMQIMMPLNMLGYVYREIRQSLVDMGEMFMLLDEAPEVEDAPDAKPLKIEGGLIEFDKVDFGYEAARPILRGLSLTVAPGETVAIVGASGAGKSTIGRLLFRFYDVLDGALRIDGQDVRDVTQESLHAVIGVVPQDTVLFNDTILYNIAYGRAGATREEIEAAAKAAQIHEFIIGLPEGYDAKVGERGLKLSGGEKQRVGIARTLLKDPPILLLDEATSALDTETEHGILDALVAMGEGRSVITIAHRLSTVVDADRIVVLEAGQVVEEGRHDALLASDGRYASLWHMQLNDDAA